MTQKYFFISTTGDYLLQIWPYPAEPQITLLVYTGFTGCMVPFIMTVMMKICDMNR